MKELSQDLHKLKNACEKDKDMIKEQEDLIKFASKKTTNFLDYVIFIRILLNHLKLINLNSMTKEGLKALKSIQIFS